MYDFDYYVNSVMGNLLPILGAIVILIIGWIIANFIANKIGGLLKKSSHVKQFVGKFSGKEGSEEKIINIIVKVIFFILIIFVVGAVFDALNLRIMTDTLNRFLGPIFAFIPKLIGAVIVLIVAWVIATLIKMLVQKAGEQFGLDSRVQSEEKTGSFTKALADIAFWVVMFLFLPLILSTLELGGILAPLQNMINKIFSMIPNIITAAIILLIGWFIATKIKEVVASILVSAGVDRLLKQDENDTMKVSEILSLLVYVLILIPVIAASLQVLGLETLAQPVSNMIAQILGFVPTLFAAVVIVFIAYFFGKIIGDIVTGVIAKLNVEKGLKNIGIISEESDLHVGKIVGKLVFVLIVFFAALQAAELLGFVQITILANQFIVLFGKVLLGLVVIALGFYVAQFVASIILKQNTTSSKLLATLARVIIVFFALAMGLTQMGIADDIIKMAFGFTLGAIAIAAAIAFGIGGRDEAARLLEKVRKGKENND